MDPKPVSSTDDVASAGSDRYWAFISYSHQDNLVTRGDGSGDHIEWANWLHEQLESFVLPEEFRDRLTRTGETMPERFFPTFRDEAELPTSHDLDGQIRKALEDSRFLIVIASPRSARSCYVNEEVRYFREIGRYDRILVLIVDGEPNVRLHPKAGWTATDDCFCPALVHPLRADGSVDDTQALTTEPIAADVRVKDCEPAREMRAKESKEDERRGLLEFMKLKLLAGIMGVGLDELVQRDKRRVEEQEKRTRQALSRTEFLFARQLLDLAEEESGAARLEFRSEAYARLSRALERDPENRAATVLGLEQLRSFANRGSLRNVLGPAVFSPCGCFLLSRSGAEARLWDAASCKPFAEPLRHEDRVNSAVFSPDGARILTASGYDARLWDAASGRQLGAPLRHEDVVNSAVFSPDGGRILTVSNDHAYMQLWDAASGQALGEFVRHVDMVKSAVFSPDGTRLLTTSYDKSYGRLWDVASGQPIALNRSHDLFGHSSRVTSAVFSPDGGRILTASVDTTAKLWDAAGGELMAAPLRHEDGVNSAVFSPDGGRILTASNDKTARLWDAASGKPFTEPLRHDDRVTSAVFSPDGGRILTASGDRYTASRYRTTWLWDAASGQQVGEPLRHERPVTSAVFSPDGGRVLTTSDDNTARLWDVPSGPPLGVPLRHEGSVQSAVFNPDGTRILTTSNDKTAKLWDAASGKPVGVSLRHDHSVKSADSRPVGVGWPILTGYTERLWGATIGQRFDLPFLNERSVNSAVFSPDGERILTASDDNTARLWDAGSGQPLGEPLRHENGVNSAVFSPDGARILTASNDKTARLWDASSGKAFVEPLRHDDPVTCAVFSPDGGRILTVSGHLHIGSQNRTARLWDTASGQPLFEPLRHEDRVNSAVFSPDGRRILTASDDNTARLWDTGSGQPLSEPLRHEDRVNSAVFSPDGRRILTASDDNTARLWDTGSGQPLTEPLRHEDRVNSAVFSPDGRRILTASDDNTARLWDTGSGKRLAEPLRHKDRVNSAVFSPDGRRILTVSSDRTARVWDAASGVLEADHSGWLNRLLEIAGGRRLNDFDVLAPVPPLEIVVLRQAFDNTAEIDHMLLWWSSDPFTRPVQPASTITVPFFVRSRIGELLDSGDDHAKADALRQARDAFPHHPLVLLCDALAEPAVASDPEWLRQYAVSRLLAEPHYLVPLEPPNAMGDAKANRQYEVTHGLAKDCYLGARLLLIDSLKFARNTDRHPRFVLPGLNDCPGSKPTTDPKRIALARHLLERARELRWKNVKIKIRKLPGETEDAD